MSHSASLTHQLNPQQYQAVTASACHQLIIAGAGSGKTRVLVHRIAWLIEQHQVPAHQIMAVTFTNKAANTLKSRIENLRGHPLPGGWIGTFHSLCHRLLRQYAFDFKIDSNFQIIDQDDQLRLIKQIQQDLGMDDKIYPAKKTQYAINQYKEAGIRAHNYQPNDSYPSEEAILDVYKRYEAITQKDHLVDFNELILKVVETLSEQDGLRQMLQSRFMHILVDEFQDSNPLQYQLIKSLAGHTSHISIVGDDDQSIYSWRGAQVENMLSFPKDFPDVMTIRLEQNYRSSANILEAANHLIAHNKQRLGKELCTEADPGEKIKIFTAHSEYEEARYVIQCIQQYHQNGLALAEQAILYRSNAQSRVLEEQLARHHIPYRVYGGLRFFDRAEIKDVLAYMRLVVNPGDSTAFTRIINTPTRGIGQATLEQIHQLSDGGFISLWQAAHTAISGQTLSARAKHSLKRFVDLIETLQARCQHDSFSQVLEQIIQQSGYIDHLQKQYPDQAKSKLENLEELINACQQFEVEHIDTSTAMIAAQFLANITLDNQQGKEDKHQDCVQLMTLHSAKGLEFDCVYLSGMEEGLCPHKMALQDGRELEEERRLCYVGITRARTHLHISYAESRRLYNQDNYQQRSRFLAEIPYHLTESYSPRAQTHGYRHQSIQHHTQPEYRTTSQDQGHGWRLGQVVHHDTFGPGVVLNSEGEGEDARIQIRFQHAGVKWLLASYAKLKKAQPDGITIE
ncbi:MAG: UvrD-helicase domain-containing protein [Pseudomonadota bacterium]|nr:UvrD-helicase domain-containing protein [Pseudomonadota bacterium]